MKTEEKKSLAEMLEEKLSEKIEEICDFIFNHPELGGEEVESANYLTELMRGEKFSVTYPYGKEKTAFRAERGNGDGPVIGFLAEYDALPGYGPKGEAAHACGHNWISAVTAGTAIVLGRMIESINGKVVLIGTPAEETYNGKALMLEEGCFDDLDIVMQAHLEEKTDIMAPALAMDSLEFSFKGKPAHAAQFPYEGINALDAVQLTFAGVNALRQQIMQDVRIHGIVTNGGQAVNIIPENASCKFYVRGKKRAYVDQITQKVINCAKGAELMTGAKLEVSMPDASLDDIVTIPVLGKLAEENMQRQGFEQVYRTWDPMPGSTDIGNVSNLVPTLYTEIGLDEGLSFIVHDESALAYANSSEAYKRLHQMVKSFAGIALDLFDRPVLVAQAKAELKKQKELY
ncbi:MAG: M20 family metallopeptidase [Anaerovoracaceae bacterium]